MRTDLEIIRGDTLEVGATLDDAEGAPVDDAGAVYVLLVKAKRTDADGDALLRAQANQSAAGVAQLAVSASDVTDKLTGSGYFYAVRVTETGGQVTTLAHGLLTVRGG